MTKYTIPNIKPYGKISFQCNFQILFIMVNYLNKPILPLLTSYTYIYNARDYRLYSDIYKFRKLKDAFRQIGLYKNIIPINSEMITQTKDLVRRDIPVGLIIHKQFMEKFKDESQEEKNQYHHLLIHGFDDNQGIFNTIDHNHHNSFVYTYSSIKYSEVQNFITDFENLKNEDKNKYVHYYFLEKTGNPSMSLADINALYLSDYKSIDQKIKSGLCNLQEFCQELPHFLYLDNDHAAEDVKNFYSAVLEINNTKRIELFKWKLIFGETNQVVTLQEEIIKAYVALTGGLGRCIYYNEISKDSKQQILNYMLQIHEKECAVNQFIISM